MRHHPVLFSFLVLMAASCASEQRPNIVVFRVDDMGVMDTSLPFLTDSTGKPQRHPLNDYYRTPNMERLAARGIRFNNFCAMSVCPPSRISLMTGQNAARHRTTNWINPDQDNRGPNGPPDWNWQGPGKEAVTLPSLLRTNGYRTIHVGKGHFGPPGFDGADPTNLGFVINVAGRLHQRSRELFCHPALRPPAEPQKPGKSPVRQPGGAMFGQVSWPGHLPHRGPHPRGQSPCQRCGEGEKTFFLHLAHYAVHAPFNSDPRFAASYTHTGKPANAQAFATLFEGIDKSLGDLFDHLDALGIADHTLVIFLGDNGTDAPLGDPHEIAWEAPLRGKKGSYYVGGMRVPFIAAWAGPGPDDGPRKRLSIAINAIQSQQAAIQDLFPTLLNLTGINPPPGHVTDGRRLDTLLAGTPDPTRDETLLMHYPHAPHRSDYWTSYRDGAWKVIYHYFPTKVPEGSHYQLSNLTDDPFEQTNLATTHPAELQRLMKRLIAGLEDQQAIYPMDNATATPVKPRLPQSGAATGNGLNGRKTIGWN